MNRNYVYSSSLAPYIEGLICQKRADGFLYEYEAYILKTFDDFCLDNGFHGTVITRDLVMEWAVQRKTEGVNYRNQSVDFQIGSSKFLKIKWGQFPIIHRFLSQ